MTHSRKHMAIALTVSTILIIFNIIAVTQGTTDNYYSQIKQFIVSSIALL
jgi:hypothetical protein